MEALKQHIDVCSLRTLGIIVSATSTLRKIIWTTILICAIAACAFYCWGSVVCFLQYPVGTSISLQAAPIEFPAVSFCNLNPYKVWAMQKHAPKLFEAIQNYSIAIKRHAVKFKIDSAPESGICSHTGTCAAHPSAILSVNTNASVANKRQKRASANVPNEPNNVGKTFYTSFLPDISEDAFTKQLMLTTSSPFGFPVTITANVINFNQITANIDNTHVLTLEIDVPPSIGIKLTASQDFILYSMHLADASADGSLLFPLEVLGTNYVVLGTEPSVQTPSYVQVVATGNGTNVTTIALNGTKTSYVLNEMDVIELTFAFPDDPTGLKIVSDQPVAVIVGHPCRKVPLGCAFCDHLVEQLPPLPTLGTQFALTPFEHTCQVVPTCCTNSTAENAILCNDCYEIFKVMAVEDSTTVERFGSVSNESFVLSAGEWRFVTPLQSEFSYLVSDKPLLVAQYLQGSGYQGQASDPSLVIVPPTNGFSNDYRAISCSPNFATHYMTIIIHKQKADGLRLNDQPFLNQSTAHPIPITDLNAYLYQFNCSSSAQFFTVTHLDISVTFSLLLYGYGTDISYVFMAGARFINFTSPSRCVVASDSEPPDFVDNDCDGWVDEELRNFIDDDGDGLIDEDLAAPAPIIIEIENVTLQRCNLTFAPQPQDETDFKFPVADVYFKCAPGNMSYFDAILNTSACNSSILREWSMIDACGNIANDVSQFITMQKMRSKFNAPPTAYLQSVDFLNDANETGLPSVNISCDIDSVDWNWTYVDTWLNDTIVNRIWTIVMQCDNVIELQQNLILKTASTIAISTTTTATANTAITTTSENIDSIESTMYVNEKDNLTWSSAINDALPFITKSIDPSPEITAAIGYQLEDIIFWCKYNGQKCQLDKDFQAFSSPKYGNCFTFNWEYDTHNTFRAGSKFSLQLIFNTPSDDYLEFSTSAGYKLLIHDQDDAHTIDSTGITCSARQHYSFAINKITLKHIGQPYDTCASNDTDDVTYFCPGKAYSADICIDGCYQSHILDICNCGSPHFPLADGEIYCNLSQKHCVDSTFANMSFEQCNCPPACSTTMFDVIQTKSIWPTPQYVPPMCFNSSKTLAACQRSFKHNYSRVDIYYNTLTYIVVEENAQYTWVQLQSDIFSQAGLWIGMCIISVVEILLFSIMACLSNRKEPDRVTRIHSLTTIQ